jgi:tRNA-splicing ligase RtcB
VILLVEIIYTNLILMQLLGSNKNIPVFGDPIQNAIDQMDNAVLAAERKGIYARAALMADHHLGYSVPVGGVIAYRGYISPSAVGYDISCGNKAVLTTATLDDIRPRIHEIMDLVYRNISFGIGRVSNSKHISGQVDPKDTTNIFDRDIWSEIPMLKELKDMAVNQLGTVGSGNHYVDIFADEQDRVWIGVHFGSRGLGHKIATHYIKAGGGTDGINVDPALLSLDSEVGQEYVRAMNLAGDYAYAGRSWVCSEVARILGGEIVQEVHNHHNFSWCEEHDGEKLWVTRKGATPAFPDQLGFVGGTMGENSVILKGVQSDLSRDALYSTVHGAGRVLSRTQAAGKSKWKKGVKTRISDGLVSQEMMDTWVNTKGVCLRGAGVDESPHCYKRLNEVLEHQGDTIQVLHTLRPIGVAMAGADIFDPYKD